LLVIVGVCALLLAIPAGIALLRPHHPPKLTPENLRRSVEGKVHVGIFGSVCGQVDRSLWKCHFDQGSDELVYSVQMVSDHCWSARAVSGWAPQAATKASGCL
jgi:hypothetical protein